MAVQLARVTDGNREAVARVRVTGAQRALLDTPSFADFLAEAPQHPTFEAFHILDRDSVVGLVSYGHLPQDPTRWWIPLIVIDEAHRRRGHGRATLLAVIEHVRQRAPDAAALGLSYKPANLAAVRLYLELGFERAGLDEEGDVTAWLPLHPSK